MLSAGRPTMRAQLTIAAIGIPTVGDHARVGGCDAAGRKPLTLKILRSVAVGRHSRSW